MHATTILKHFVRKPRCAMIFRATKVAGQRATLDTIDCCREGGNSSICDVSPPRPKPPITARELEQVTKKDPFHVLNDTLEPLSRGE